MQAGSNGEAGPVSDTRYFAGGGGGGYEANSGHNGEGGIGGGGDAGLQDQEQVQVMDRLVSQILAAAVAEDLEVHQEQTQSKRW